MIPRFAEANLLSKALGTRVLVLDILDWIKEGKPFDDILESIPSITRVDIQEIITYAKEMIAGEAIIYGSKENDSFYWMKMSP